MYRNGEIDFYRIYLGVNDFLYNLYLGVLKMHQIPNTLHKFEGEERGFFTVRKKMLVVIFNRYKGKTIFQVQ